jgi:hypothetical protein
MSESAQYDMWFYGLQIIMPLYTGLVVFGIRVHGFHIRFLLYYFYCVCIAQSFAGW